MERTPQHYGDPCAASAPEPYRSGEISHKLGKSRDWFYEHRAALREKFGFPQPLPGPGHPRWARAEVDAWLKNHAPPHAANDDAPAAAVSVVAWRQRLAAHYR